MRRAWRAVLVTSAFISFSGCAVGPDYQLPTAYVRGLRSADFPSVFHLLAFSMTYGITMV
jgi:hypothetical protein